MKIFSEIPTEIPVTTILNKILVPADIKNLSSVELKTLADDVRAHMLYSLVKVEVILVVAWAS